MIAFDLSLWFLFYFNLFPILRLVVIEYITITKFSSKCFEGLEIRERERERERQREREREIER